ncbi:MAG: molybdenum cofactor biosynthesis protein MoaE [Cypionkella sp.]|nr:molybdenum cofactor biosynthesis protein MoaE [Cypionkella sp.]
MQLILQEAAFDQWLQASAFAAQINGAGALVTFSGIVRGDGGLSQLEIEHYAQMSRPAIDAIMQQAQARFGLLDALVIHRFGRLSVGETIMMVATAAPHRKDAFDGAEFLMDYLKSRAPFWKKEHRADGATWVDAKAADEDALKRW